jgi:galactokinase
MEPQTEIPLGCFASTEFLESRLSSAGLSQQAAKVKAELFQQVAGRLLARGVAPDQPAYGFFVPGRIELLGKHTDYCGGNSLLTVPERGICIIGVRQESPKLAFSSLNIEERVEMSLEGAVLSVGHSGWCNYLFTVVRRIASNFPLAMGGAEIAFVSDLPVAAGMSSSSALMTAVFVTLNSLDHFQLRREYQDNIHNISQLAEYLGTVENGQSFGTLLGEKGVGTFGGSEDHTAILCSLPGQASQFSFAPVRLVQRAVIPEGWLFAIASSGVAAHKTGAAMEQYNRLSRLAAQLLEIWRSTTGRDEPHLAAVLSTHPKAAEELREAVKMATSSKGTLGEKESLFKRLEHFELENQHLVPQATRALHEKDLREFGRLVCASQKHGAELLGNQLSETCYLADSARSLGAVAASAFGAGFGGSVWSMIETDVAQRYLERWREVYLQQFPQHAAQAEFFLSKAGPATLQVGGGPEI